MYLYFIKLINRNSCNIENFDAVFISFDISAILRTNLLI